MAFVIHETILREFKAHVRIIEFRKRGLPHAHCILFLAPQSKVALLQPNSSDALTSAEIPSTDNWSLRQVILKHNIHCHCGKLNSSAVGMKDGPCTKRFPKKDLDETGDDDSPLYITYRRLVPNRIEEMGLRKYRKALGSLLETQIGNSWDVPYSARLPTMSQCHLIVALCISRVGGFTYLFQCVYKVQDRGTMRLVRREQHYGGIGQYLDALHFSASEAIWDLFQFEIIDKHPPVVQLDVHLKNHHTVYFKENQQGCATQKSKPGTKLSKLFSASLKWPGPSHVKYSYILCYFTSQYSRKTRQPRAKFRVQHSERNLDVSPDASE